jgi:nitrite reductase (NADH) small subunit/3-phenylpropionate/trans-cinnamate dioxygenase ferredoxin subunit
VGLPTREGPREGRIELLLDREEMRWVTRNLEGANAGAEIWTHLVVHAPRQLSVIVDFFVPGITGEARARLGEAFARVYHQLYDEDEAMMVAREAALGGQRPVAEAAPDVVEHEGRRLRLVDLDDGTWAVDARCPHWLGPLDAAEVSDGVIVCPWHGYGFDVRSGACTTGQDCHMRPGRRVTRTDAGLQFMDEGQV